MSTTAHVQELRALRTDPLNIFVSLSHELLGAVDHRELLRRELTEPINRHAGAEHHRTATSKNARALHTRCSPF